jgi:hypothetical protein
MHAVESRIHPRLLDSVAGNVYTHCMKSLPVNANVIIRISGLVDAAAGGAVL